VSEHLVNMPLVEAVEAEGAKKPSAA
jgi:hypothetical protein